MNNVFAHPRDFAATMLQLRPHPEADEHRPLDPLALPLVRHLQADGPTTRRGIHPMPFPDPEVEMRRREQAARRERLRQVAADLDQAALLGAERHAAKATQAAVKAARESGEQQGMVAGWRTGFRHAIFAGVLIGVVLGIATVRFTLTGSLARGTPCFWCSWPSPAG